MAPLMDHHGETCYYIGAQVDITVLIEGGRGLASFKQLLEQNEHTREEHVISHKPSVKILRELGGLLNDEEVEVVTLKEGRRSSFELSASRAPTPTRSNTNPHRRFVGMDEPTGDIWPSAGLGPSGRLPGVYQNVSLAMCYLEFLLTQATVPTRPTVPIPPHHLYLRRPPHPRPNTV
jgi:hypothetical protein